MIASLSRDVRIEQLVIPNRSPARSWFPNLGEDWTAMNTADLKSALPRVASRATSRHVRDVRPNHLPRDDRVQVIHLAAECWPFARTGGLGEAVAGLATYQARHGIAVTVIMPLYRVIREARVELQPVGAPFNLSIGDRIAQVRLWQTPVCLGKPRMLFIDHMASFDRDGIYGEGGADYADNARRFALFSLAAVGALPQIASAVNVVHAHDWHTALAIPALQTVPKAADHGRRPLTVFSVHNAGFQGSFPLETITELGFAGTLYDSRRFESYGRMNFLKGALTHCDLAVTVSPTHASELRTPEGGFGLHETFAALGGRLMGVTNGIDCDVWNPVTDRLLPARYSRGDLAGKAACKLALQRSCGLEERPSTFLVAMCTRLAQQKGFDLVLGADLLSRGDAQFVFLGQGEARYEKGLMDLAAAAPGRVVLRLDFSDELEHRVLAGADALLMPSFYEPCGLTQMRAQRYGTIPIARRVGGLADTIEDGASGFLFNDYSCDALLAALGRATERFGDVEGWRGMMDRAMSRDFGWRRAADDYIALYSDAAASCAPAAATRSPSRAVAITAEERQ
jgi:starch synthase